MSLGQHEFCVIKILNNAILANNVSAATALCTLAETKEKINLKDHLGQGVLHFVALHITSVAFVDLLLNLGAILDSRDNNGYTPLHLAVDSENETIVKKLLECDADFQVAGGPRKWTPLHTAAHRGNSAILKMLLDAGAPLRPRSSDWLIPEYIALTLDRRNVVNIIREYERKQLFIFRECEFYHDNIMGSKEAKGLLKLAGYDEQDGAFMVVKGKNPDHLTLLVSYQSHVYKYKILNYFMDQDMMSERRYFYLDDSPLWLSLAEMVHFYHRFKGGLPVTLTIPVRPLPLLDKIPADQLVITKNTWYTVGRFSSVAVGGRKSCSKMWGLSYFDFGDRKTNYQTLTAILKGETCKYIVSVMSICLHERTPVILLSLEAESLCLGTLLDCLCIHQDHEVCDLDLRLWTAQLVHGMNFLESRHIVHGSLSTSAIFVDKCHQATRSIRIGEFGPVKLTIEDDKERLMCNAGVHRCLEGDRCPVKWMAPEAIADRVFSHETDVWSFGVTLWEIYSAGTAPYHDIHSPALYEQLSQGHRLLPVPKTPQFIKDLTSVCWQWLPSSRPLFADILRQVQTSPLFL
ncbi:Tyrosine-protein kinase transforming protein Abl [Halotydeus destructor]|nr:Tyrosine-protein kinase transforming protein Abl [Halotydeus destructor]